MKIGKIEIKKENKLCAQLHTKIKQTEQPKLRNLLN